MFESLTETSLDDELRRAAVPALAAFLGAMFYVSAIPLLPAVPRWLFEAVRLTLAGGLALSLLAFFRLVLRARGRWTLRTALNALLPAGASLLALFELLAMSVPWLL